MKIYKYKVAMTIAFLWFAASVFFNISHTIWGMVVTVALAAMVLILLCIERESRRKEIVRAVAGALILLAYDGYILFNFYL